MFKRPENNVPEKKWEGVRLFGVCALNRRNTVVCIMSSQDLTYDYNSSNQALIESYMKRVC